MRLALAVLALTLTAMPAFAQAGGRLERFMRLDLNGDGAVTRAEAHTGRVAMFTRLDADHDTYLSQDERAAISDAAMARGLNGADSDNDGRLSRDEFLSQPFTGFERLDANNDGTVSAEEIAAIRARLNRG